jgi:4-amino-4-deoxy-L-arabinose transferase-like glycosyltransferase
MLAAVGSGHTPHPEWALRLPSFLLMLAGLYILYRGVARACGRRAAFIGGVVRATMPQFFLVARQAMTDMPFVAGMMAVIGCALLAAHTEPGTVARAYVVPMGPFRPRVSLFHLVFGVAVTLVMLQACYLCSRNLMIATSPYFDIRFVADTFAQGSPGNCGTPGNGDCAAGLLPTQDRLQPAVQALIWLQATALLLWLSWGERRVKRLLFLAAWFCAALATMSKGIGGLALPLTGVFLWVVATGKWRELSRMEIVGGLILFAVTALPWVGASYVRHGRVFIDRLFFDHMVKRTFGEMHQTNSGTDVSFRYYVWQLGYATFPWVGLAPIALVSWLRQTGKRWS